MINIIFDQYQRYKNAEILVNSIRNKGEKFKILEVGANEHKNLEKFLETDDVTYLDIIIPDKLKNDSKYILGDATCMDFEDNYFDIVVALDVYEHIPKDKREDFIKEIYRVCKKIVILSAPFNHMNVCLSEERANIYYKSILGIDHLWLYEHINYGLPSEMDLIKYLNHRNIKYTYFRHGSLDVWEKMTNIQMLPQINKDLDSYVKEIDKFYNEFRFANDYDNNGYRTFFVMQKERDVNVHIKNNDCYKYELKGLVENLYQLFDIKCKLKHINNYLPTDCNNSVKLYIDYGNGYSEQNTLTKYVDLSNGEYILFDEFGNECIQSIRIDPTEMEGQFWFGDLEVIDNKDNCIEVKIGSNACWHKNKEYIFINRDPQIYVDINNEKIKSLKFFIKKNGSIRSKEQLLEYVVLKLLDICQEIENKLH